MAAQRQVLATSIGLLILRLGIGGYMLTHGWGKLRMMLAGDFEMIGDPIGVGPGVTLALLVFAEFFCALLVVVGLATRFAAVPIVIAMAVAAFVAHGGDPWTMEEAARRFFAGEAEFWGSKQPALMFLIPFLTLIFAGAGRFSIDALIRWRRETPEKRYPHEGAGRQPAEGPAHRSTT